MLAGGLEGRLLLEPQSILILDDKPGAVLRLQPSRQHPWLISGRYLLQQGLGTLQQPPDRSGSQRLAIGHHLFSLLQPGQESPLQDRDAEPRQVTPVLPLRRGECLRVPDDGLQAPHTRAQIADRLLIGGPLPVLLLDEDAAVVSAFLIPEPVADDPGHNNERRGQEQANTSHDRISHAHRDSLCFALVARGLFSPCLPPWSTVAISI